MGISEKKMQIVINNYFEQECDVNTSIREAFEKGFRIGAKKGLSAQPCSDADIQKIQDLEQAQFDTVYHIGVEEGLQSAQKELSGGLYVDGYNDGYRDGMKDAQPKRPNGEWIPEFNGNFTGGAYWFSCSKCKRIVPEVRNGGWNYCPNCGAEMEC